MNEESDHADASELVPVISEIVSNHSFDELETCDEKLQLKENLTEFTPVHVIAPRIYPTVRGRPRGRRRGRGRARGTSRANYHIGYSPVDSESQNSYSPYQFSSYSSDVAVNDINYSSENKCSEDFVSKEEIKDNSVNVVTKEEIARKSEETEELKYHQNIQITSGPFEFSEEVDMVGRGSGGEKKKLLDMMSLQFNTSEVSQRSLGDQNFPSPKRGRRGSRAGRPPKRKSDGNMALTDRLQFTTSQSSPVNGNPLTQALKRVRKDRVESDEASASPSLSVTKNTISDPQDLSGSENDTGEDSNSFMDVGPENNLKEYSVRSTGRLRKKIGRGRNEYKLEDGTPTVEESNSGYLKGSRGSKRGRGRSRGLLGSPALRVDSPLSESSGESAMGKVRGTKIRNPAFDDFILDETTPKTKRAKSESSAGRRGRRKSTLSKPLPETFATSDYEENFEEGKSDQIADGSMKHSPMIESTARTESYAEAPNQGEISMDISVEGGMLSELNTDVEAQHLLGSGSIKIKKKKKHFKGLKYSFVKKKKKPKFKSHVQGLLDNSQETESLASEDVDGDSFDSSSQDLSHRLLLLPGELDPYDPSAEFDDSHSEKSIPLSLRQQREAFHNKDKEDDAGEDEDEDDDDEEEDEEVQEENAPMLEDREEEEEVGGQENWSPYAQDGEEYEDDDGVPEEEAAEGEEATEDLGDLSYEEEEIVNDGINEGRNVEEDEGNDEEDEEEAAQDDNYLRDESYEVEEGEEQDEYNQNTQEYEDASDEEQESDEQGDDGQEYEDDQEEQEDEIHGVTYTEEHDQDEYEEQIESDDVELHREELNDENKTDNQQEQSDQEQGNLEYEEELEDNDEEIVENVEEHEALEEEHEELEEDLEGEQEPLEEVGENLKHRLVVSKDHKIDLNQEPEELQNEQEHQEHDQEELLHDSVEIEQDHEEMEQEHEEIEQELEEIEQENEELEQEHEELEQEHEEIVQEHEEIEQEHEEIEQEHGQEDQGDLEQDHDKTEANSLEVKQGKDLNHDELAGIEKIRNKVVSVLEEQNISKKPLERPLWQEIQKSEQDDVETTKISETLENEAYKSEMFEQDNAEGTNSEMESLLRKRQGLKRTLEEEANAKDMVRKSKRLNRIGAPLAIGVTSELNCTEQNFGNSNVADPSLTNVLCKCRVKENPKADNLSGDIYCQAIDSFDGRMIGCCNIVNNDRYLRVSSKIPYMLLCSIHRQRVRRHNCCPGCGLFCTQGVFAECRWDKLGSRHYYHKLCGLLINGVALCPHCGTDQASQEVHLELKLSRKPIIYLKQHQETKGFTISARMSSTKNIVPEAEPVAPVCVDQDAPILEINGKVISPSKLPVPMDKHKLTTAINAIKIGKSINIKPAPKGIYWSCKQGDLEKLLHVLVNGVHPNARVREYGNQMGLHTAANHNCIEAVHILVCAGASLDLLESQLQTPLMIAIVKHHNEIVQYLVQAGANLAIKTSDCMTCLHLAAKSGNFEACRHILDSGRLTRHAINVQDEGGWTPLVWASENRCINVVKILLDRGANPQICDVEQNTALHWAAFSGSTHICSMVIDRGCSLRSMNAIGDTPLHIAARQNHVEAVVLLLARGASLDIKNAKGQTPLDCAFPDSDVLLQLTLNKELRSVTSDSRIKSERILSSDIAAGKETVPIPCVNGDDDEGIPKDYVYIAENCEAINVNIDRTIASLKYCECEDGCISENCICSQLNFQCWYDPDGKLLVDFNYADPPMIFECNRACSCNKLSCQNRVVQHGMTSHLQLFRTAGKGWGVRALKDIPKGSYVCEYVGEIITDLEADQREDDSYLFDLDNRDNETYCIDARQYGNVARFINHLCEPNLTPVKIFIDHQDLIFPRIAFFANRDIEADEELGFDYGEKFWVIKYKHFTCMCASSRCKYSSDTIHQTLENYNKKLEELNLLNEKLGNDAGQLVRLVYGNSQIGLCVTESETLE